jgi:hypothetical protein
MNQENVERNVHSLMDVRLAMAIANAVFAQCQKHVEKWSSTAPDTIDLEAIVANVLKGTTGVDVEMVRKEVEQSIAFLRDVLIEPVELNYGKGVGIEVRPATDDDRVLVHQKNFGYSTLEYSASGLQIQVFNGDESRLTPIHRLNFKCTDLVDRKAIDLDGIAEWVGLHYGTNFDSSSTQDDWIERYLAAHYEVGP